MLKNMKFRSQMMFGNTIILCLMVIIGVVVFTNVDRLTKISGWVAHTHEVLEHGNALVAEMVNMETGQRGFLISGREASLEPYINGEKAFKIDIANLLTMVETGNGSGVTASEINGLKSILNEWITKAANVEIEARRSVNLIPATMDDVAAVVEKGTGKKYMDGLRAKISELLDMERDLLVERGKEASEKASFTKYVVILGILSAILIGFVVIMLLMRSVAKKIENVSSAAENVAQGSNQMSASSVQMSQGATEQASSAEEASAAMEQMSSTYEELSSQSDSLIQTISFFTTDSRRGRRRTRASEYAKPAPAPVQQIETSKSVTGEQGGVFINLSGNGDKEARDIKESEFQSY